ncbi:DUF937 domain-containing protein [Roseibacillus ishigakijimensis]|uniref:DUF937 domain-containing protein n=1 Tax=Roseibacillus ishigakijimensis TaxID=454146 RepID=A0A934RU61_9BACT|nr:DUF937 domain-containing protein [Roseibacillus ishigakijimensis]MBK1835089.1 DUF937 domain-containing protein [Roseibacillus ishigakijimensis]
MSFVQELLRDLGGPVAKELGQREGMSEDQSKSLLEGLAPVVLGGLKRRQEQGVDVESLARQLGAREEGVDQPGSFFDGPAEADLKEMGGLDQAKQEQAAQALAQKAGIGVDLAKKVLPVLIPVVLSYLMRKGSQDGATPDRRSGMSAILDRDGDGKIIDDLAGMVLAGHAGGRGKGGLLAMILAFFTGRK